MELKTMGATINFAKNEILRDMMRDAQATLSDVERWAHKLPNADTLDGVLGKQ